MPLYKVHVSIPMVTSTPEEAKALVQKGLCVIHDDVRVEEVVKRRFCVREYRDWYVNLTSTRGEEWSSVKRKALAETEGLRWPASQVEVTEVDP